MVLRVGLTGGLASGKSTVGRELARQGCLVVQADELGHYVLEEEAREEVLREFGTTDRRELAAMVFGNTARLETLNAIVHPAVRRRVTRAIREFEEREPQGIAVTEAAILIETGSHRSYDKLIVAFCDENQQIERAMARDGWSREQVMDRLARQMPLEKKKKYADYLIDTSGSREWTEEQTRAVYRSLRGLKQ